MTPKQYPQIGETLYHTELENGLHIYVDVKPEFSKSYAFFATHYGGMDMRYYFDGGWQETPAGVAHFLEHKMFDTKDGNALQDLAANGASPNAFTSIDITGYYFESTEKFEENLRTLLSFVSVPWFTKESVDKEQGIIGQEIRMVEDDPGNQVFYGMLEALYAHNPIRISIAGTVESIADITWRAMWTLTGCRRLRRRFFRRKELPISQGTMARLKIHVFFVLRQSGKWRFPPRFSSWDGRQTLRQKGKSICGGNSWGSFAAKRYSVPPVLSMRAFIVRA